ncbi:hypothetical protein [Flavobacterium sp. HJJ]|uniref:hypothetical protein n=1 Tax=Flavobacterium sp. HJJ TaxID=2783792 RepID=UPI00188D67E4|nr:hypothetical protein [Flavobacterium sp. HJJ]MBF4472565.1 hypothetical protein [Flavobacterium sp. HJJ]
MNKFLLIAACTLFSMYSKAQDSKPFAQPESVNSDEKYLYVTNIGVNPDPGAADGDGFISKADRNGKVILKSITN